MEKQENEERDASLMCAAAPARAAAWKPALALQIDTVEADACMA
jgi:hypothetical protein